MSELRGSVVLLFSLNHKVLVRSSLLQVLCPPLWTGVPHCPLLAAAVFTPAGAELFVQLFGSEEQKDSSSGSPADPDGSAGTTNTNKDGQEVLCLFTSCCGPKLTDPDPTQDKPGPGPVPQARF